MASPPRLVLSYYLVVVLIAQLASCYQLPRMTVERHTVMFPLRATSADSEMNWDPKSGPKLDFNEDYYSVLDVESTVDVKELKKAYYKLVFKYHPDNIENESTKSMCNKQMMVINGAYRILKNINLRIMYDRQRRKGLVGAGAGIKESSVNSDGSKPVSAPTQTNEGQQKAPPKTDQSGTSSKGQGKKYSGTGFGGSWSSGEENNDYEDDSEEEYNDQERERERQRQRYQEPQPQPQTQRERDQQVRDREREFDFTYDQRGVFTQPKRTPWGFNTDTYDEPVRPSDTYRDNTMDDVNNVEEFLRRSGSGVSDIFDDNISALKRKLEILCARKVQKDRDMDRMSASIGDWGEVTDVRLIRKRIEDINEIKSLTQEISELADEIADVMLRSRTSSDGRNYGNSNSRSGSSSTYSSRSSGYRPPVDLWGESPSPSPSPSNSPRQSTRPPPPPRKSNPPRSGASPVQKSKPTPGSVDWDAGRNNVKGGEEDYLDYNFDEETLEDFGGNKNDNKNGNKEDSTQSPWRKSYQERRNPSSTSNNSGGQAFASFLFEDEIPLKKDYEGEDEDEYDEEDEEEEGEEESDGAQNSAVLNELLRIFNLSKKSRK